MRSRHVLTAALIIDCCLFGGSADASSTKTRLRFDGFYRSEVVDADLHATEYLRFYPDGIVLRCCSTGEPQQVANWFRRELWTRFMDEKFRYSVKGRSIRFREYFGDTKIWHSGTIRGQYLDLHSEGRERVYGTKRWDEDRRFMFVKVLMLR